MTSKKKRTDSGLSELEKKVLRTLRQKGLHEGELRAVIGGIRYPAGIPEKSKTIHVQDTQKVKFALVGDTHIGSKHFDEKALHDFYDIAYQKGVRHFYQVGDLIDGENMWRGHVYSLYAHGLDAQVKAVAEQYPKIAGVHTFFICLSPDTEVFANGRWKNYNELRVGDEIWSLDEGNSQIIKNKITQIQIMNYKGILINFKNTCIDFSTTPDHSVLSRVQKYKYQYKKASEIKVGRMIPVAGLTACSEMAISDDIIKIIGWVVTEGTYAKNGSIQIYQDRVKNRKKFEEIKETLNSLKFMYSIYKGKKDSDAVFYIFKRDSEKIRRILPKKLDISNFIFTLSKRQLIILLDILIKGDGTRQTNTSYTFYSVLSKALCEQVQLLAIQCGFRAVFKQRNRNSFGYDFVEYSVQITERPDVQIEQKTKISHLDYEGIVFDITTEKGNFLARRNGKPFFTGNCGNHDNSFKDTAGVNPGKLVESARKDMHYIGSRQANVHLGPRGKTKLQLLHPGGGSSYALSYRPQKIIDAMEGGTKPHILAIGHYHKIEQLFYRNIHSFLCGTLESQTGFMAERGLAAHKGSWIVEAELEKDGGVRALETTLVAYYK